jgi:hypothetical protein
METMPLDKPGLNTMAATKQALSSTLSMFTGVNPRFLSASTRLNTDHQNPQHFKGLQSISKQMSRHMSVRTPHLGVPRQSAPIRGYPRLSTPKTEKNFGASACQLGSRQFRPRSLALSTGFGDPERQSGLRHGLMA